MTTYLVQNDNLPDQVFTLVDDTGAVVNLTFCTVNFYFSSDADGTVINDGHTLMTITDALNGIVTYVWDNHTPLVPADLATPGKYSAEIEVTFATGKIESVYDTFKYQVRQELGVPTPP